MTPEHRAAAIVEQAAAGYLDWREQCDRIAAAIRAAIAAEREACAALAESLGATYEISEPNPPGGFVIEPREFAAAIRERGA